METSAVFDLLCFFLGNPVVSDKRLRKYAVAH